MDQRDNRYNNMGPRLDLGLRPPKPGQNPEQAPYRRQPAAPQQTEQLPLSPASVLRGHSSQAPDEPGHEQDAHDQYNQRGYEQHQYQYDQAPPHDGRSQPGSYRPARADYTPAYNDYAYGEEPGDYSHNHSSGKSEALAAPPKTGAITRLLMAAALLLSIIALAISLFGGSMENASQATLAQDSELVPGATAERVAKLEKDMSSLLLKMVTLEKELEAIKNRNWSPSAIKDLGSQVTALQNQLKALDGRVAALRSSASAPASAATAASAARPAATSQPSAPPAPAPAATSQPTTPPAPAAATPPATSQVADRAGDKPDPLATRMDNRTNTGGGQNQPRHTYTVQPGDTLFSVAQRYQVTTKDLMKWNNMSADDVLRVGKVLVIH